MTFWGCGFQKNAIYSGFSLRSRSVLSKRDSAFLTSLCQLASRDNSSEAEMVGDGGQSVMWKDPGHCASVFPSGFGSLRAILFACQKWTSSIIWDKGEWACGAVATLALPVQSPYFWQSIAINSPLSPKSGIDVSDFLSVVSVIAAGRTGQCPFLTAGGPNCCHGD